MEKLAECVTPDDVRRAIEIMYNWHIAEGGIELTWAEWLAHCQTRRGQDQWRRMAPDSADPGDYPEELSAEDRALVVKVGAVVAALMQPPIPAPE